MYWPPHAGSRPGKVMLCLPSFANTGVDGGQGEGGRGRREVFWCERMVGNGCGWVGCSRWGWDPADILDPIPRQCRTPSEIPRRLLRWCRSKQTRWNYCVFPEVRGKVFPFLRLHHNQHQTCTGYCAETPVSSNCAVIQFTLKLYPVTK